jgi:hypothetical protein
MGREGDFLIMLLFALALAAETPLLPVEPMFTEISRDPITDQVKAFAIVQDGLNRISVGCDPTRFDGIRVTLTSQHWLGRGEPFVGARGLTYRFDDAPARRMMWMVEDRSARIFYGRNVRSFVRWLATSQQLTFRTRTVDEHRLDISIRLVGTPGPLRQVLEACGEDRLIERVFPDA